MKRGKTAAWASLAAICFAIFLAALDQTAVSALLPVIVEEFEGAYSPSSVERGGWIVTAYLVGYTVVMPVMGRVADLFGHRRIFNVSIVVFMLGSVLCALSTDLRYLAAFRALQAVGGGAMVPIAMGIAGISFPLRRQAMAIGLLVAAGEAGGVVGPLYGAYLAEPFGWQWIFWINIPLGLAVMGLVWLLVEKSPRRDISVDYRGALLLAAFLSAVTVGLSGQRTAGWYEFVIPMLAAGAVFLGLFVWVERRQEHPTVRLSMFRNVTFSAANAANLLEGVALITALVQVPFFAYATVAATPIEGGLLVIQMTIMIPVGAVLGGLAINRLGHRFTAAIGFAVAGIGLYLVSRWTLDVTSAVQPLAIDLGRLGIPLRLDSGFSLPVQTRDLLITGFGFGFNSPALAAAVVASVPKARLAAGSALHIVSKMAGEMIGLAAFSGWGIYTFENVLNLQALPIFDWRRLQQEVSERSADALLVVLHRFFLVAAILCAVAIIPSLFISLKRDAADDSLSD